MFGHVNSDVRKRGQFYLFYTYHGISGGPVLAALVAGDAAIELERLSQQQAVSEVMVLLRSIFGPQGVDVPDPLQVRGGGPLCSAYPARGSTCVALSRLMKAVGLWLLGCRQQKMLQSKQG
jgi:hypothetical protein